MFTIGQNVTIDTESYGMTAPAVVTRAPYGGQDGVTYVTVKVHGKHTFVRMCKSVKALLPCGHPDAGLRGPNGECMTPECR